MRRGQGVLLGLVVGALAGVAWFLTRPVAVGVDGDSVETSSGRESAAPDASAVTTLAAGRGAAPSVAASGRGGLEGSVRLAGVGVEADVQVHRLGDVRWLGARSRRAATSYAERHFVPPSAPSAAVASTRSGADGAFRVVGLAPGYHQVTAVTARGDRGSLLVFLPTEGARVAAHVEVLAAGCSLEGRVVHADGRPFAGQVVVEGAAERSWMETLTASGPAVPLDAQGRFRAEGLPAGRVSVRVLAGDVVVRGSPILLPRAEEYVLTVDASLVLARGRVVRDEDGSPVAGAFVVVTSPLAAGATAYARATTDGEGRYEVLHAASEAGWIGVTAEGFLPATTRPGATTGPELPETRLVRGATVTGRVTRASDGAPVGGLTVTARPLGGRGGGSSWADPVETDAAGRYAVTGVAPGPTFLLARGAGHVAQELGQASARGYNPYVVEAIAGATTTLDLVVVEGARLAGVVLDDAGRPVAGAVVSVRSAGSQGGFGGLAGMWEGEGTRATAEDGTFRFDDLVDGLSLVLTAQAPGFAPATSAPAVPRPEEPPPVEIRFAAPRRAVVLVLDDAAGSPIAGARVALSGSRSVEPAVFTGADGTATVGPLEATARLDVEATGYARRRQVELAAGETTATVRLVRGVEVSGRVVGPDDAPIAGAQVVLEVAGNWASATVSAADGTFRVADVPAVGAHRLRASAIRSGVPHAETTLVEGARSDVVLRLKVVDESRGGVALTVRVLGPDGTPVSEAQARLSSTGGSLGTSVREGRVVFRPDRGAKDRWLDVWGARGAGGGALAAGPLRVQVPDDATELEVRLPPEVAVRGVVLGPDGEGVRGVQVAATPAPAGGRSGAGSESISQVWTDAQGAFRVGGLAEVDYLLSVAAPSAFSPVPPVSVRGGEVGVEIRLRAGVAAVVTVRGPDGEPVPGVSVTATLQGAERNPATRRAATASATTDARGEARLQGLDPDQPYGLAVSSRRDDLGTFSRNPWTPGDETVRLPRVHSVSGTVRDLAGNAVPNAYVMRKTGEGGWDAEGSDERGAFHLKGLGAGPVTLRAALPEAGLEEDEAASPSVTVAAGARDVVLTLDLGLGLVVRVVGRDGPEASRSGRSCQLFRVRGAGTDARHAQIDGDGVARFRGLRPGDRCTIFVGASGADESVGLLEGVAPGGEVEVRLVPGRRITGRVALPAGTEHSSVGASRPDGLSLTGTIAGDGRYEIRGVPEGTWRVQAWAQGPGRGLHMGNAEVAAGGSVDLELKQVR